jgi:hypothetical protein
VGVAGQAVSSCSWLGMMLCRTIHDGQHDIFPCARRVVFSLNLFRSPTDIATLARSFSSQILWMHGVLDVSEVMLEGKEECLSDQCSVWVSCFHSEEDLWKDNRFSKASSTIGLKEMMFDDINSHHSS